MLKYLVNTNHRHVFLPHLNKLFDEKVLLGSSLSSRENLRCVEIIPVWHCGKLSMISEDRQRMLWPWILLHTSGMSFLQIRST